MSLNHIQRGQKFARASVKVAGRWIKRHRSKSLNSYRIDAGEPMVAFKTSVPEEVANILKVIPQNFQRQVDPMFWLTSPGGVVAKEMNELTECGRIDGAVKSLKQQHRSTVARLQEVSEQRTEADKELANLKWLSAASRKLKRLEAIEKEQATLEQLVASLTDLLEEIADQDRILKKAQGGRIQQLSKRLVALQQEMAETVSARNELRNLCHEHQNQNELIESQESLRETLTSKLSGIKQCPLCQNPIDHWH